MSAWGVRWNPWSSSYSSLEADQMRFIHKAYCEAMEVAEDDLPTQLKMDDSFFPLYRPTLADFDEHTFMRKMQNVVGLLRNPAEAIISTICAYQKERNERITFSGYLNDPRTLLLEEFKDWAMRTLAPASCTTENILHEVRRRHSYVLRLQHGQQGLFHAGSGERSLLSTLKDVRNVIESRILPSIEAERAHSSAREQLHTLEARGTDGLMHGVQFLFYVLRNTANTPGDCTISHLQSQQHTGMKDAMQSKSGQMLQLLLTTPSFRTLFPDTPCAQQDPFFQHLQLTNNEESELIETAVFCDQQAKPMVPVVLTRNSKKEIKSVVEYLSQANSGVVSLRPEAATVAYDTFTRLHGLLKLLADLLVSCRKARQLAGPGGDLLVYGPGGEEVRRLMQSLEAVQTEISRLVTQLTQIGVHELDRLKPNQERAWRTCFSKVLPLENYIAHDFGACVEPIQRIYANADPLHVQKLYRQFREATGLWVKENNQICRHVCSALGSSFIDRIPTKTLEYNEEEPQDQQRVMLLEDSTENANEKEPPETNSIVPFTGKKSSIMTRSGSAERTKEEDNNKQEEEANQSVENAATANNLEAMESQLVPALPPPVRSSSKPTASTKAPKSNQSAAGQDSPMSIFSQATAMKGFQSVVSWAVGTTKPKPPPAIEAVPSGSSPQNSDTDEEDANELLSSASSTNSAGSSTQTSKSGVLDVLLLVRQSIQRVGQLSWGVRTSYHTSAIDDTENFDAFVVLCAIYEAVGVPCASDLLVRLNRHRLRLRQVLQKHIGALLRCIFVLQRRLVDEQKCFGGMSKVYHRLEQLIADFEMDFSELIDDYQRMLTDCARMKDGILTMPLLAQKEFQNPAFNTINALATRIRGSAKPSSAILSHGQYMTQVNSEMDLHWNSISHLLESLKGCLDAVGNVTDRLKDYAKDSRAAVSRQQLDYIFEYNYDGFFRHTTRDLQVLLTSFEKKRM